MQNFFAKVNGDQEIDYVIELLIRYRHDLLAIEYARGTECFGPATFHSSLENAAVNVTYYECLTRAYPEKIHYLTSLGYAYLRPLLNRAEWMYEFQGGSDFQILAKADSVANLLENTSEAQEGAELRMITIELIADYTLAERGIDAAQNYMNDQLSKHVADTLLIPNLHWKKQKLILQAQVLEKK